MEIEKLLTGAEYINSYTVKEQMNECITYEINGAGQEDIREKLFYLFAHAEMPILEFTSTLASLEDVFLELTSETQPGSYAEEFYEQEDNKMQTEEVDSVIDSPQEKYGFEDSEKKNREGEA